VVKVEKVKSGTVAKQGRKRQQFKPSEAPDYKRILVSTEGSAFLKYTPNLMNSWPRFLKNFMNDNQAANSTSTVQFSKQDLLDMKDWPFWRVQLKHHHLTLDVDDR
jgi:hypothetical protein